VTTPNESVLDKSIKMRQKSMETPTRNPQTTDFFLATQLNGIKL